MEILSTVQTMSTYESNSRKLYEINKQKNLANGWIKESEYGTYEQTQEIIKKLQRDNTGFSKIFNDMLNSTEMTNAYIETMESVSELEFSNFSVMTLAMHDTIEQQEWEKDNKDKFQNSNDYNMAYFKNMISTLIELDKNPNANNGESIKTVDLFINNFQNELDKKDEENKTILESYKRNNKVNPLDINIIQTFNNK